MKNLKFLNLLIFLSVFISCGTSKNVSNESTTTRDANPVATQRTTEIAREGRNSAEEVKRMEARNNAMFEAVKMDSDQIRNYKSNWKELQRLYHSRNSNRKMNPYEQMEQEDKLMKNLLDEQQYERYQQWRRANPITDTPD